MCVCVCVCVCVCQGRRNGFVIGGAKKILRGEAAQNFFLLHFHIERIRSCTLVNM